MGIHERKGISKTSVKIWNPLIGMLDEKLNKACLRRDAYLTRLLELEIEHLDEEVSLPNSKESYDYVLEKLDDFPRKLVSLALPTELIAKVNAVCERKRIVRDAFFNRLYLLLAVSPAAIDSLFFDGRHEWRQDVWNEFKVDGPFFHNGFYPLEPDIDPFWAIRKAIEVANDEADVEDYVEPATGKTIQVFRDSVGIVEPVDSVYTRVLENKTAQGKDLVGFSCYLSDWRLPGHPAEKDHASKLDAFLKDLLGTI